MNHVFVQQSILTGQAFAFILVSALWGSTNPLIKKGGAGIETVDGSSSARKVFNQLMFLCKRWQVDLKILIKYLYVYTHILFFSIYCISSLISWVPFFIT